MKPNRGDNCFLTFLSTTSLYIGLGPLLEGRLTAPLKGPQLRLVASITAEIQDTAKRPSTLSKTTAANFTCAFVENTIFTPILKSQDNRIELVTKPGRQQLLTF